MEFGWTVQENTGPKIPDSQEIKDSKSLDVRVSSGQGLRAHLSTNPFHWLSFARHAPFHGLSAKVIQHAQLPSCLQKRGGLSGLRAFVRSG
jgi:hypothetical protein